MKKSVLMLIIAFLLFVMLVVWWFWQNINLEPQKINITIAVLIMVVSFILEGIKNILIAKRKLVIDDELSKKAEYKAGYHSYLISVYIWLALYFLKDLFIHTEYLVATGIYCMSITFIIIRFIYRKRGDIWEPE